MNSEKDPRCLILCQRTNCVTVIITEEGIEVSTLHTDIKNHWKNSVGQGGRNQTQKARSTKMPTLD